MDKKKLIGTIVGVVAFALIIAGATYAWLTYAFNATNGNYNTGTLNFNVAYTQGTDITAVPILSEGNPTDAEHLTVTAKLAANSTPGNLTIYVNTDTAAANTSAELIAGGVIKYAVCQGTCADFTTAVATGTIDTTFMSGATAIETGSSIKKKAIVSDVTLPLNSEDPLTYNIYFWLDGANMGNEFIGAKYTGYISAEASQVETRKTNNANISG